MGKNNAIQSYTPKVFTNQIIQAELKARPAKGDTFEVSAEDAALGLGYTITGIDHVESVNWKLVETILTSRGYDVGKLDSDSYISENMFYQLAMHSNSPKAIPFQRWAADEVFVSIRKNGFYAAHQTPALENFNKLLKLKTRYESIEVRKSFTAVIKLFIEYAHQQGDRRDEDTIYKKFTSLANKLADIKNGTRPKASGAQNEKLKNIENAMANLLIKGMAEKKHYSKIEDDLQIESIYIAQIVFHKNPLLLK